MRDYATAGLDARNVTIRTAEVTADPEQRTRREQSDILTASGVDLSGWELSDVNGISADGQIVAGNGINPDGNTEAWWA